MAVNPDYGFNPNNKARWISLDDQYDICEMAAPGIALGILRKTAAMLAEGRDVTESQNLIYAICLNAYTELQLKFVGKVFDLHYPSTAPAALDGGTYALYISEKVGLMVRAGNLEACTEQIIVRGTLAV